MNGRAYDYNLGRFLSVDPFIQAPGNSQSMNPYSYIMNNPLAGTDPSGYRSICGGKGQRKCDAVIDFTGRNGHVGTYSYSGPARANGFSQSQHYAHQNKIETPESIDLKMKDDPTVTPLSWAEAEPIVIRYSSGGTENRSNRLDEIAETLEEGVEMLEQLDQQVADSKARITAAGNASAEAYREGQIARIKARRDTERQQDLMRQQEADSVVMDHFPDGVAEGHKVTVTAALAPTVLPALMHPATAATVIRIGAGAVKHKNKVIKTCALVTSLCNLNKEPLTPRVNMSDVYKGPAIMRIKQQQETLRRVNDAIRNTPTKVK